MFMIAADSCANCARRSQAWTARVGAYLNLGLQYVGERWTVECKSPIAMLAAAMVAKVPCNLTPRHPPSQVVDNLPRYAG
jgi:hypothetical protein